MVTPVDLGHAPRPPCGHGTRRRCLTMGVWVPASDRLAARRSGASGGRCRPSRQAWWGSADASRFASGMQRDRVESEGSIGTNHGLSLLLRKHVAGSAGAGWERPGLAHNPEVEGSNPSPATTCHQGGRPLGISGVNPHGLLTSPGGCPSPRRKPTPPTNPAPEPSLAGNLGPWPSSLASQRAPGRLLHARRSTVPRFQGEGQHRPARQLGQPPSSRTARISRAARPRPPRG